MSEHGGQRLGFYKVRAGEYRSNQLLSSDKKRFIPCERFYILRQPAFESDDPLDPAAPEQWFLYDEGNLVDAYDTLREARSVAQRLAVMREDDPRVGGTLTLTPAELDLLLYLLRSDCTHAGVQELIERIERLPGYTPEPVREVE